jgi:hypothetical protein
LAHPLIKKAALIATVLGAGALAVSVTGSASAVTTTSGGAVNVAAGNPIPGENAQQGSDKWQVPWAGYQVSTDMNRGEIKGFATTATVTPGATISFKVTVNKAQTFSVDIFRLGYYKGLGGRLMLHKSGIAGVHQPACTNSSSSGMLSCKNWSTSYTATVGTTWVTGIYEAVFTSAGKFQSVAPFWVADYSRKSDVLFLSAFNTYEAYNNYPWDTTDPNATTPPTGKSLYDFNSAGGNPASQVSFDRPFSAEYGGDGLGGLGDFEPQLVQFMEKSGYDVSYNNDVSVDAVPARFLDHRAIVIGGHSEYWSKAAYDGIVAARDKGRGLAFMSSNEIFWQIRYANNRREIICHKNYTPDPETDPALKTTNWRASATNPDPEFRFPGPNRPEQTLLGVQLPMFGWKNWGGAPFVVTGTTTTNGKWVYANTGLTNGKKIGGATSTSATPHLVGYEMDAYDSHYPKPPGSGFTILAASKFTNYNGQAFTHNSTIYKSTAGNYVWATGTMAWSWGLVKGAAWGETDVNPEGPDPTDNYAPATAIITRNVLNKEITTAPTP